MGVVVVPPVTVSVAVAVGLGETPAALKVMVQEWLPDVALAVTTEALRVVVVLPPVGASFNHAQSLPREVVNARPDVGLVLVTASFWAAGAADPLV